LKRVLKGETVQPGFRAFVSRMYGEEGRAWLARLPGLEAELAARWRFTAGPELPGGLLSLVRDVTLADGGEAVLKIGYWWRTHDEIAALRAWQGRPAPSLLAADEALGAMLLERIRPGKRPAEVSATDVAVLLRHLHVPAPAGLTPLAEVVRNRIEHARRDGRASQQKAGWALAKLDELDRTSPPALLLHGDLDERNLLLCARRRVCAIDPMPCRGDPAYDAGHWVHGNRRPGRRARLDAIVNAGGLERARVRDWAAVVGVHG
jgi:streptomycin 6-kinase